MANEYNAPSASIPLGTVTKALPELSPNSELWNVHNSFCLSILRNTYFKTQNTSNIFSILYQAVRILIFKEYSTSTFKQFHFSFACRSMKNPTPPTHILFFQLFFFPQTPMKALLLLIKNILFSDACLHLWHLQNLYHKNILHFYFDLQEWKANLLNHCYCFFHGTDH